MPRGLLMNSIDVAVSTCFGWVWSIWCCNSVTCRSASHPLSEYYSSFHCLMPLFFERVGLPKFPVSPRFRQDGVIVSRICGRTKYVDDRSSTPPITVTPRLAFEISFALRTSCYRNITAIIDRLCIEEGYWNAATPHDVRAP
jgi:hypothetical protein